LSKPGYVILDTDAFSFLLNRRPQAASYGALLKGQIPTLTFVSVAELHFGALSDDWQDRRYRELEARIAQCVILPYDNELSLVWTRLRVQERRAGRPLGQRDHVNDLWIAACGIYYDAPILTGNLRHFSGVPGLRVIDGSGNNSPLKGQEASNPWAAAQGPPGPN
jgi:tRNA(fMet)-specific endonuclease VapC